MSDNSGSMFHRFLNIRNNSSFFLFGPRGTGKSTFISGILDPQKTCNLDFLDYELETKVLQDPGFFRKTLESLSEKIEWVFIDEVQKAPFVLNEVHRQIESPKKLKFAMTGSSARKLKRGQANLLAGRALTYTLHPLTTLELKEHFRFDEALLFGTLPKIFSLNLAEEKNDFLRSYAQTYLKEEIQSEGLIRNLPAFRKFLPLAASENGNILSWSNFAQDVGIDVKTIRAYYEILEDTLIGFILPAYHRSLRKRQKTHPKFYFFDTGVRRALANELTIPLLSHTTEYGRAFEHFWITEIYRLNLYQKKDFTLSYLATHDMEIDLVIERPGRGPVFLEIKSSNSIKEKDLKNLQTLTEEVKGSEGICLCSESYRRKVGSVLVCPWREILSVLNLST